jgi:hypothetical protein
MIRARTPEAKQISPAFAGCAREAYWAVLPMWLGWCMALTISGCGRIAVSVGGYMAE